MRTLCAALIAGLLAGVSPAAEEPASNSPVTVEQAEKQVKEGIQILDVRTGEEWKEGHLKGAKRVELQDDDFVAKVKSALDPKKPVLVYCRSGGRSARASKILRQNGFISVSDMKGGITAWEKAGKPLAQ